MPSNVMHNYLAKCALIRLDDNIKEIIQGDEKAYLVGAQGPDVLFYLRYEKEPISKLGYNIHKNFNAREFFTRSAVYASDCQSDTVTAYLMGMLCHYALDSVMHPYVYAREKQLIPYYDESSHKPMHVVFESALDYMCIKYLLKANTRLYKGYKNLDISNASKKKIAIYYSSVVAPLYDTVLPPEKAEKAFSLMKKYLWLCDDMTGGKFLAIRAVEKFMETPRKVSAFIRPREERMDEDWFNLKKSSYPKYLNEDIIDNKTVEEMLFSAEQTAIELINDIYNLIKNGGELNKDYYNINYSGERLKH